MLRAGAGLGAAAVLPPALAGCAGGRAAEPRTSGEVELAFWTHDEAYADFFEISADIAERETDFRYRLRLSRAGADDLVTKTIAQAIAGRGTPDVIGLEIGTFPRLRRGVLAEELLTDLTDHIGDAADDLLPSRTAPFSQDGHLYALDSDAPLVVYYYRASEFERLGIPADLETWEELAEAGALAHRRHGVSLGAVPVGSEAGSNTQGFEMLLLQRGGRFFEEDGSLGIETPEAEEVLGFIAEGLRTGFLSSVAGLMAPPMQAALESGAVLGQWMATWYRIYGLEPNVPEQAGQWRIRPLPAFAGGGVRTSFAGGTGFAAIRGKENTLAGVELVKAAYLTPSEQVRRFRDLGYLPTRRSVYEDPELLAITDAFCGDQPTFEVYRELIDEAPAIYLSPDKSTLDTVLSGYLLQAYRGEISPRDALARAADDFRGQTRNSRD
ncbi:extracellular solute-binding protein [Streptomyces sp. 3MP-14]|uniref:Extracellular solute-binding protein n=1 Tax=Streptomyces mimosae TaxID=2586635 RepID=A0A5N5ZZY4_9ACTN|nr:extracellular solute-binding protein [Streptomyces mimosae]KAB8173309.1 extracellular solute-binding protein [Streptomyces sp. 3MP-14]